MSIFVDADYGSLNKFNEELCGDKVEIIRNSDSVIVVLADGLGSGVKANILATLTSKIIGTMLSLGSSIDEAVETIINTLPICKERELAYSTFSILQIYDSGESYLVEFDNPSVIRLVKGKFYDLEKTERVVNGKHIQECRFLLSPEDIIIMLSDGAIHAGVGKYLNLGWQWENVKEYSETIYKKGITAKSISKNLLSACNDLYADEPGDDTTVVTLKARKCVQVNVIIGPPFDNKMDKQVVKRFLIGEGKKVVCGGTTSQIVSRETGKSLDVDFNYIDSSVPPIAKIEGIDLTTEGILTMEKAVEYAQKYVSSQGFPSVSSEISKQDGASKLARLLLQESTSVHFFVGRAVNPAHQNTDLPLNLGLKLKLVDDMEKCLMKLGIKVEIEYF